MKKTDPLCLCLSFILLIPFLSKAQSNKENTHSIRIEMALANLRDYSTMDGHKLLFEYRRNLGKPVYIVAGFSLSQSINEIMSDDPKVVNNPELIREGYNGSSLDFFAGLGFDLLKKSDFSLPLGLGITPRLRTESYPNPNSNIQIELFRIDENGDRVYAVMTETIYQRSFDIGLYGTLSAAYRLCDDWRISLQSRYQVYTEGFPIFSIGAAVHYLF